MNEELEKHYCKNSTWIASTNIKDFSNIADIYKFFVLDTPLLKLSGQAKALSSYGWKSEVLWTDKYYFLNKFCDIIYGDVSLKKTFSSDDKLCMYLENNKIDKDYFDSRKEEIILFRISKSDIDIPNEYYSFFKHVRNSFAHGLFKIKNDNIIMEDHTLKTNKLSSLMIISKKRFSCIINYLINYENKDYIDYETKILNLIKCGKYNKRADICRELNIEKNVYEYYRKKLYKNDKIVFVKGRWIIKK